MYILVNCWVQFIKGCDFFAHPVVMQSEKASQWAASVTTVT